MLVKAMPNPIARILVPLFIIVGTLDARGADRTAAIEAARTFLASDDDASNRFSRPCAREPSSPCALATMKRNTSPILSCARSIPTTCSIFQLPSPTAQPNRPG
jgi:hypothetical protein